jgi:hypothetical protein
MIVWLNKLIESKNAFRQVVTGRVFFVDCGHGSGSGRRLGGSGRRQTLETPSLAS